MILNYVCTKFVSTILAIQYITHPIPSKKTAYPTEVFHRSRVGSRRWKLPRQRSEEVSRRNSYLQWLTFRSIAWGQDLSLVIYRWLGVVGWCKGVMKYIAYNFWRGSRVSRILGDLKIYPARFPFEIRRSTWNFWFGWFWGVLKVPRMTTFKIWFSFSRLGKWSNLTSIFLVGWWVGG